MRQDKVVSGNIAITSTRKEELGRLLAKSIPDLRLDKVGVFRDEVSPIFLQLSQFART